VVTVSLNGTAQSAQVVLSDIAGKIILTANGNTQGMNLDLSTVPAGMYVLNVHTATGTGAVKLVVNH
jgi:ribosomal protein L2